ncbi:MAG TPA: LptA/OstA family protein [Candidatus Sulfotelmatobacter sp.]|nr:LptA/OstA family protein [Candidatus Sulfotelmatobacter sp.]
MTLKVYRLRRLLAATAVLLTAVVTGMYLYARWKATDVLTKIPGKIGYDIKQTATGFQFSKSDGKRTLFTIQASDLKEFKLNGRAELHNVSIVLYGRDASRFDQIYGDDFSYDQKTGDVTAKGEVQIDLVANPAGLASPDQTTPKELKNPIHLKTRDLVFNKETGNAWTDAQVDFRTPQAAGSAVGVKYAGKSNTLTLSAQLHVVLSGVNAAVIDAHHGVITNEPREIVLDHPHLTREGGTLQADQAVFHLGSDNNVERVLATGNVSTVTRAASAKPAVLGTRRSSKDAAQSSTESASETRIRSDQAEFLLTGKRDLLRTATLTGNVHLDQQGAQPMQGDAGRLILDFAGQNQLQKVHAVDGAHLTQRAAAGKKPAGSSAPQDFELTAPVIDFTVAKGHILQRAATSGAAQITLSQPEVASTRAQPSSRQSVMGQKTVVTAGTFVAQFAEADGKSHLASIHGAPGARIVSSTAGQSDRVSTSDSVDAAFLAQGGIESVTQQGNVLYTDSQAPDKRMQASANSARYTPADQMLMLTGGPRVVNGGMATTAKTIRINRATGDAIAEGDVKSTYSELKEQPDGALLASSSPIHVASRSMTAHNSGVALYSGNARLWQDANIIEAPSIQFDRDHRSVVAQGTLSQPVQTILIQPEKGHAEKALAQNKGSEEATQAGKTAPKSLGKTGQSLGSAPLTITSTTLTYADSERRVHYEGGVLAKTSDFTASSKTVDAYLLPRSQTSSSQSFAVTGQLDRMVAQGDVVIRQPNRRAEGQKLVYTAADDKFVLTGGPPSIFDAEQGKITGVSLTFFRRDDRVLVEGGASTPVVTQTRVAR